MARSAGRAASIRASSRRDTFLMEMFFELLMSCPMYHRCAGRSSASGERSRRELWETCILLRRLSAIRRRIAALVLTALAVASCRTAGRSGAVEPGSPAVQPGPPIIQPGAPGEASRVISAERAADLSQVQFIGADIRFMQGMIGHHAQAVAMVALVPSRTSSEDVK